MRPTTLPYEILSSKKLAPYFALSCLVSATLRKKDHAVWFFIIIFYVLNLSRVFFLILQYSMIKHFHKRNPKIVIIETSYNTTLFLLMGYITLQSGFSHQTVPIVNLNYNSSDSEVQNKPSQVYKSTYLYLLHVGFHLNCAFSYYRRSHIDLLHRSLMGGGEPKALFGPDKVLRLQLRAMSRSYGIRYHVQCHQMLEFVSIIYPRSF